MKNLSTPDFMNEELNNFSSTLQKEIDACVKSSINRVLIKIHLNNQEFLVFNYGVSKLNERVIFLKSIVDSLSEEFGIEKKFVHKVGYDFFVIIENNEKKISDYTFTIFKKIQLCEQNKGNVFLDYKLSSIAFPSFGIDVESLLTKLRFTYQGDKVSNLDYHIVYDDNNNNIIRDFDTNYQRGNVLKNAIFDGRVMFAFQPIVSCRTGHINHYECLLRIIDHRDKLITAGPLIPVAEKLGFISIIDDMVVDMVIDEITRSTGINFAINISNLGVSNKYLINKLKDKLSDKKIASRLIIEITETAAQDDLDKTKQFIKTVHDLGAKIAIDDFGAGYTSFKQLKLLPIDLIKIDGWFIKDVLHNLDNRFFVEVLVKMADELGTQTIAEFVENGEIAKFLLDIDVDYMQGNYFSPAIINRSWTRLEK